MNSTSYRIWRWHIIAGIISLPFIILLSITGGIYLFKDDYEASNIEQLKQVTSTENTRLSYQEQWEIAKEKWSKAPSGVIVTNNLNQASQFVSGRFSHKSSLFINPFTGNVNGEIQQNKTDMHKVRKLHGELLLAGFGTKIIELIACWMIVLIFSGIYTFWPKENTFKNLFTIRFNKGKRTLYRDLHSVLGFWFSILLLLILAGGLPWTDVFGSGYKWIHETTNTGFSKEWKGFVFRSEPNALNQSPITLDEMMAKAKTLNLLGEVQVSLPKSPKGVYSISNQTSNLSEMHKYHFNQYTGDVLYHGTWVDIGVMMRTRLWVMAFHQGQFGTWNWILVLTTTLALLFLSITALLSYLKRRQKGTWGVPPANFSQLTGKSFIGGIVLLGLLLPLFGLSLLIIYITQKYIYKQNIN